MLVFRSQEDGQNTKKKKKRKPQGNDPSESREKSEKKGESLNLSEELFERRKCIKRLGENTLKKGPAMTIG